jgi:sec-independent protein translocase protein TatB
MLNLGLWEMMLVAAVALIFVGPERLPEMLRFMGRFYGKIRAMTYDIRREFTLEVDKAVAEERRRVMQERREEMRRHLEAERQQRAEEQGETYTPEPEYVQFDADPTPEQNLSTEPLENTDGTEHSK